MANHSLKRGSRFIKTAASITALAAMVGTSIIMLPGAGSATGSTNTSDNPNSAFVFNAFRLGLTDLEDSFVAKTSYKGFREAFLGGSNRGANSISWTTQWFACSQKTDFKATDADFLNSPNDQVANEAALDALLVDAGCVALTSGGFNLTRTNQNPPDFRQDFIDFDATGKQFVTAKMTAAVPTEITTFAISDGFDRPTITPRTLAVSSSGQISAASAVTEGDLDRGVGASFQLCDSKLIAQNDISSLTSEGQLTTANCTQVFDENGNAPTDVSQLFEQTYQAVIDDYVYSSLAAEGFLHVVTSISRVVWDISEGVDLSGSGVSTPGSARPYEGPIGLSTPRSSLCVGEEASVTGSRLSSISKIYIDNIEVPFTAVSDSKITFTVPEMKAGKYQTKYWVPVNSVNLTDSITIGSCRQPVAGETTDPGDVGVVNPTAPKRFFKSKRFSNYLGDRPGVISADEKAITAFLGKYQGITSITCLGSTSGVPAVPTDMRLATNRANNACDIARKLNPEAKITIRAITGRGIGQFHRSVSIFVAGVNK